MNNSKKSLIFPIVLVLYEIATYLSNDMYLPSLPGLEKDFNVQQELTQYTLLTWFLGAASMHLIMGPLSDRYGRRAVLLSGGVCYVLATIICALTENIGVMLLARFIQGTTVCSVSVAGYAAIHELYESKTAIKVITIMGSVTVLAPAFGPMIGAIFIEFTHWRAIFWFLAGWAMMTVGALWKIMPETNPHKRVLHFKHILSDYTAITLRKSFLGYVLPFSLLFMTLICWIVETPFLIIENYQESPLLFGLIQIWVFGAFVMGAQITSRLVYKITPISIIQLGLSVALMGGVLFLLMASLFEERLYFQVFSMIVISFGVALAFGPLHRCAIETCSEPMGSRMAIFFTFMNLFGVIGTFLVAALHVESMENLSCIIFVELLLAGAIFYWVHKKTVIVYTQND